MFSSAYLCICIYCMLQLLFLIFMEGRRHLNVSNGQSRYFLGMHIITLLSFAADISSSFHTDSSLLFPFSAAGNYLEIIFNAVLIPLFFSYICEQISKLNKAVSSRLRLVLWMLTVLCAAIIISTAFTGQIFYFDEANNYHRGPLFPLPMGILLVMMVIAEVFLISQKRKIEPHYYRSLLFFIVPPMAGWALQLLIYGLPFSLLGITFASLILYVNIQNRSIDQDYLTGVFNRQALDRYMQHKIDASSESKSFSAILLDINDFKSINDHFGHYEGDTALINSAHILRDSLEFTDFIARYGGDEFCIILDTDNPQTVENAILQINKSLMNFNNHKDRPYQLSFSIGYETYQPAIGSEAESFFKIIDQNMYKQKNIQKSEQ